MKQESKSHIQKLFDGIKSLFVAAEEPQQSKANPTEAAQQPIALENFEPPPSDIEIKEYIWGRDTIYPGELDYMLNQSKTLGLKSSMNFINLTAGLGGLCRKVASDYDMWATGLERNQEFADSAMQRSVDAGLSKKAAIEHYDPDKLSLKEKYYDGIIAQDLLYKIKNKNEFLDVVSHSLKHCGQFIFTDFVFTDDQHANNFDLLAFWSDIEKEFIFPISLSEYQDILSNEGYQFEIRIQEDISEHIKTIVLQKLGDMLLRVQNKKPSLVFLKAVFKEISVWATKISLMDQKIIRSYRFCIMKNAHR